MVDRRFGSSTTGQPTGGTDRPRCGIDIRVDQVGRDVVVEASGTLDLDGLIYRLTGLAGGGLRASDCLYFVIGGGDVLVDLYEVPGVQLPALGPGNRLSVPHHSFGDKFGFTNCNGATVLYVARAYSAFSRLRARSIWNDTTIAALGLTRCVRRGALGANTLDVDVGGEPADVGQWSWGTASRAGGRF